MTNVDLFYQIIAKGKDSKLIEHILWYNNLED